MINVDNVLPDLNVQESYATVDIIYMILLNSIAQNLDSSSN